ncbi:hypothetical protein C0J52_15404 [Blattella germanica]|nr:hypothetical protein C0J52_15404 [Blattella germanica]
MTRWIDMTWWPCCLAGQIPRYNPFDYYLWEWMKIIVFSARVNTGEDLVLRIHAAAEFIHGEQFVVSRQWTIVQFHVGFIDFEVGCMNTDDDSRPGRQKTSTDALEKDCRVTCVKISEGTSVYCILTHDLKKRKFSARWVPYCIHFIKEEYAVHWFFIVDIQHVSIATQTSGEVVMHQVTWLSCQLLCSLVSSSVGSCAECEKDADWKCVKCEETYCGPCFTKVHKAGKTLSKHEKIPVEGIIESLTTFSIPLCGTHTNEKLVCYCEECKEMICAQCLISHHSKHAVISIKDKRSNLDFECPLQWFVVCCSKLKAMSKVRLCLTVSCMILLKVHGCLQQTVEPPKKDLMSP